VLQHLNVNFATAFSFGIGHLKHYRFLQIASTRNKECYLQILRFRTCLCRNGQTDVQISPHRAPLYFCSC